MPCFSRLFLIGVITACVTACRPTAPIGPTVVAATSQEAVPTPVETVATIAATATPEQSTLEVGTKVDIGGYQLYVRCTGRGAPPVVFDAGASSGSSAWSAIEPNVAAFTTACVYDRANRGRSDKGPIPTTSQQQVRDLHTLLANVQVSGPFVLVGQSFGGMNMGLYARLYPAEAVGLVMVDAVHERGYVDQSITPCPYKDCNGVDLAESGRQVQAAPPMPDIPLIVLQHGRPGPLSAGWEARWPAWQQELAARSPRGKLVLAERSTHNIHRDQPELVVAAIQELVEQVRLRDTSCNRADTRRSGVSGSDSPHTRLGPASGCEDRPNNRAGRAARQRARG